MSPSKFISQFFTILSFISLILLMIPTEYIDDIYSKVFYYRVSILNEYSGSFFNESKDIVINRIEKSPLILNKDFLINRIERVEIKAYESAQIIRRIENTEMSYLYNEDNDMDIIIVNNIYRTEGKKKSFIHELMHLVDRHKKVKYKIDPSSLLFKPTLKKYLKYYKDFPKLDKSVFLYLYPEFEYLTPNTEKISIAYFLFCNIYSNSKYMLSDPEIYVRTFVIEYQLNENIYIEEMIKNNGGCLSEEFFDLFISEYKSKICSIYDDISVDDTIDIIYEVARYDIFYYQPIINWEKQNEINSMLLIY